MANLFFVYTPFQLLVAQNLIHQEGLHDNHMLCSYLESHKYFLKMYHLMKIDGIWQSCHFLDHAQEWSYVSFSRYFFRDIINVYRRYFKICNLLKQYHITDVYLGDINNINFKFFARYFSRKGIRISFFEDGTGHYMDFHDANVRWRVGERFFCLMADVFLYLPLFRTRWARYDFKGGYPNKLLPTYRRYSLIPLWHETYDRQLQYIPLVSENIKNLIAEDIKDIQTDKNILILSSPVYELVYPKNQKRVYELYIETLQECFERIPKDVSVHLKFHPREREDTKMLLRDMLRTIGIRYCELSRKISIPAEYYLQHLKYFKMMTFYNATAFYNGYLYDRIPHEDLLLIFWKKCKCNHIKSLDRLNDCIAGVNRIKEINKNN